VERDVGDPVVPELQLHRERISANAVVIGDGCSLTRAAASMTAERVIGMPVKRTAKLDREFVLDVIGVPVAAPRMRCVLLHLEVLSTALRGSRSA
jgi:NifU-like protein involved in Fe-S cluster formation